MVEELKNTTGNSFKDQTWWKLFYTWKKNQIRQDHKMSSPRIIIYHRRYLKVVSSITNMTQNGMKECFLFSDPTYIFI